MTRVFTLSTCLHRSHVEPFSGEEGSFARPSSVCPRLRQTLGGYIEKLLFLSTGLPVYEQRQRRR